MPNRRAFRWRARQLTTHDVTSPPLTDAVRKVYSIASSAVASRDGGTVRPSAFAVWRLRDQSLVAARERSFQSAPCFCQFIRMWRLVALFLPSATAWPSATQWNRTIAAVPTTRILGSWYSSNKNFVFPLVALAMNVALSSTRPSEWL